MALIQQPKGRPGVWVARRDFERLREFGQVYTPDYVLVASEYVVLDYDPATLESRPIGLLDPKHPEQPEGLAYLQRQLEGKGKLPPNNDLFRPQDLLTLTAIARRTSRTNKTIWGWSRHPTFPKPVLVVNRGTRSNPIRYFSYPEVKHWMRTEGLSIRVKNRATRKTAAGRKRPKKGRRVHAQKTTARQAHEREPGGTSARPDGPATASGGASTRKGGVRNAQRGEAERTGAVEGAA